jgi:hypothetical protein
MKMISVQEANEILKSFIKRKSGTLDIKGKKTNGLLECMLASFIFYSPNFLFLFPYYQDKIFLFMVYNFVIIYLLISTIAHLKFGEVA